MVNSGQMDSFNADEALGKCPIAQAFGRIWLTLGEDLGLPVVIFVFYI